VPAYRYPRTYGPKSPSFARATHVLNSDAQALFVSGTASILGHETVHTGDIVKQCEVTLSNIAHLISLENLRLQGHAQGYGLHDMTQVKAYVRHASDLPIVKQACDAAFRPSVNIEFMIADICRSDLLVEIEGIVPFSAQAASMTT
jgi:chorismatase